MEFKHDLFLSHNNADKPWAEFLATAIETDRTGPPLKVFFDKWDISPGGDIPLELEDALQNSRYIGLILSPGSLNSDWVSLERSTAIYKDPRARSARLIPLLRKSCDVPDMIARLSYIDFRHDNDFSGNLNMLINLLRGRPIDRGNSFDISALFLREDAMLLRQHCKMFNRPAFRTSCIWELFIHELIHAVDDTGAAINTGSLYSRSQNLLSKFPEPSNYKTAEFKEGFKHIAIALPQIKRVAIEFEELFQQINPSYSHHANFYSMIMSFIHNSSNKEDIRTLILMMDKIDSLRNEILSELNKLLIICNDQTLDLIELSSSVLKEKNIGGADMLMAALGKL